MLCCRLYHTSKARLDSCQVNSRLLSGASGAIFDWLLLALLLNCTHRTHTHTHTYRSSSTAQKAILLVAPFSLVSEWLKKLQKNEASTLHSSTHAGSYTIILPPLLCVLLCGIPLHSSTSTRTRTNTSVNTAQDTSSVVILLLLRYTSAVEN